MTRQASIVLALTLAASPAFAKDIQFWNLTANTIVALQLSPAGRDQWGANQTDNDADHAVDHDERLKILGVGPGVYDVKFTDKTGRTCVVKGVEVMAGRVFSIEEKRLEGCKP